MTFADFINAVLIVETVLILFFVGLWAIGVAVDWIDRKLHPRYPQCSIDPREHPAFARDKDGNGWIGNVRVRSC